MECSLHNTIDFAVSETCRDIIWNCLVEDTGLFLRHFFEKLTNRAKQVQIVI